MIRAILELILTVLVITMLRSAIGIVMRGFGNMSRPADSAERTAPHKPPVVPSGGELKKDPVCGTFISMSTALQKRVGGETYYFCSPECRDKFKG
jgi:YHS domain-containing protein